MATTQDKARRKEKVRLTTTATYMDRKAVQDMQAMPRILKGIAGR